MATLLDSYSETNRDDANNLRANSQYRGAQSFTTPNDGKRYRISSAKFYLQKYGAPSGNAYVELYTHSGTYGTSSVPTGLPLATSGGYQVSALSTSSYTLVEFTFTNGYIMEPNTKYCIGVYNTAGDADNFIMLGADGSSPSHGGNASLSSGSWAANSQDDIFYVYGNETTDSPLTNNLVSYYKLDESSGNAADSVGSNTLTNNNSTTYDTGKINNGAVFNGTKSLSITDAAQSGLDLTSNASWSWWWKSGSAIVPGETRYHDFINKYASAGDSRSYQFTWTEEGNFLSSISQNGVGTPNNSCNFAYDPGVNTWHHFVVTYEPSVRLAVYVDGVLKQEVTASVIASIRNGTADFQVRQPESSPNFTVTMDEVGVWSRTLTATEVAGLYNDGLGSQYAFTDLKSAKVLVVAGGGGGGGNAGVQAGRGGGGAGGVIYNSAYLVSKQAYSITVGGGGAGGISNTTDSVAGSNSVFSTLTAIGGGKGGSGAGNNHPGGAGGSGGGGTYNAQAGGDADYISPRQGYDGGAGSGANNESGGGGGGAAAVGATATSGQGGNGGIGIADADVGNLLSVASAPDTDHIAGGGGGGTYAGTTGSGGNGGGGNGGAGNGGTGVDGTANTGGGGGGASGSTGGPYNGGAGGSGIVIIAYTTADFSHTGGNATGTSGSETWVKFTADGTLTLTTPSATKPSIESDLIIYN